MLGKFSPSSIKENIKQLIAENKHKQAIDLLKDIVGSEGETLNEILQQSARLEYLRKLVDSGAMNYSEAGQEMNKIISALLSITDTIVPNLMTSTEKELPIQNTFSNEFGQSFQKLNFAWGSSLAFSLIGLFLILIANFNKESGFQSGAFLAGIILIFLSFLFFLLVQLKGTLKVSKSFNENQEIINELQKISLDLTRITKRAAYYSAANTTNLKGLLDAIMPSLKRIGIINEINQNKFDNSQKFVNAIINYSDEVEDTIKQLEKSLIEGDSKKLQEFAQKTKGLLNKVNQYAEKFSSHEK